MAQRKPLVRACRWQRRALALLLCLLACRLACAAGVTVEVHGVDEELKANVLAYLSFERYRKGGAELTADTVERLHERVEREVQSALKPYGFYEPQVDSTVTELGHNDWRVEVNINPGKPVLLEAVDVSVTGPGANSWLFERILARKPRVGERLNHLAYETLKTELQRTAATFGYLDAKLTRNELIVDPPNHKASIVLEMQTGERYRFGETTIVQDAVKQQLVRRFMRYHQGDYFDLTQVLRTQFALDDAQYFVNLEVQPGEPDRTLHTVPITIRANARRKNRYSLAPGYATDTGWHVTAGFEDRLLNREGHSFALELQFSQVSRYNVLARYGIPVGDPAVDSLAMRAQIQQLDLADVTTYTQSFGPSLTMVTGKWQQVWSVNAVHTTSQTIISNATDRLLVPELDLASVPPGYLGEPLFEHPFFAEIKGSDKALGSDSNFIQAHVQAERVFQIYPGWHLLLRDEIGATLVSNFIQAHMQLENTFRLGGPWHLLLREEVGASLVSRFSNLPTIYRFFGGGDNSVRGFYFNELSPTTPVCQQGTNPTPIPCANPLLPGQTVTSSIKTGGKDIFTGTVEVIRDLPKNLGVAAFFDYGNAFDHFGTQLYYSAGVGLRVRLSVMTLGVDLAQPLNAPGGPRLNINFSPKL